MGSRNLDDLAAAAARPPNGGANDDLALDQMLQVTDAAWDLDKLPPRPWIAPPYILRKHITLPHGPGGVGKSQLILTWAAALALGQPFGRLRPLNRCRVLLGNFEDDDEEQKLRLSAALKYFSGNPTPLDLEGYLYRVTIADEADATMFELDRDGAVRSTRAYEALEMWCREIRPDVTALDTLVAINAVPEDNNTLMRRVMAMLRRMTRNYEMALVLAHHDRKSGGDDEDSDQTNVRGAGDIPNAARFELAVKKMTPSEADHFQIDGKERASYFRLGSLGSKVNYIAADDAEWFERVTHVINGTPVGACIPWIPPDAFEGMTTDVSNAILDDIEAGLPNGDRFSDSNSAKERAAWKVIVKHLPGKSEKQARRVINKWVKNEVMQTRTYHHSDRREDVQGLFVNNAKRPGTRLLE
jgi:AAA domain